MQLQARGCRGQGLRQEPGWEGGREDLPQSASCLPACLDLLTHCCCCYGYCLLSDACCCREQDAAPHAAQDPHQPLSFRVGIRDQAGRQAARWREGEAHQLVCLSVCCACASGGGALMGLAKGLLDEALARQGDGAQQPEADGEARMYYQVGRQQQQPVKKATSARQQQPPRGPTGSGAVWLTGWCCLLLLLVLLQDFRQFVQLLCPPRDVPSFLEVLLLMMLDVPRAIGVGHNNHTCRSSAVSRPGMLLLLTTGACLPASS